MNLIDTLEKVNQNKEEKSVDEAVKHIAPKVVVEDEKLSEKLKGEDKKEDEPKQEVVKRVKTFTVSYDFDNKKTKSAALSSKIMDAEARTKYERVLTALAAGQNFETLPSEVKNRYYSLSRIACQLIDPPTWVLEAVSDDLGFCFELGRRLIDHENAWFRWNDWDSESNTSKARFSISG